MSVNYSLFLTKIRYTNLLFNKSSKKKRNICVCGRLRRKIVDFPIIHDISRHDVIFFNAVSDTRHNEARYYISHAVIRVKHCCWGTCRSDSRYAESEHMEGVSWFPFPKPITQLEKCQSRVKLCGRKISTVANVNKSTYI